MAADQVEQIWSKLLEYNPCCSCCDGDCSYLEILREIGGLIDGRSARTRRFEPNERPGKGPYLETVR